MALSCQVSLNYSSYAVGQSPSPQATVFVFNPGAAAIVVTSMQLYGTVNLAGPASASATTMLPVVPPTGPGQTVSVPAGGSINIGPFSVVAASAANVNPFQMVNQTGNLNPINPQPSQPAQYILNVGARVYGSDLSVNEAGTAPLLVSYYPPPPPAYQGGYLQFGVPNNFIGFTPGWP